MVVLGGGAVYDERGTPVTDIEGVAGTRGREQGVDRGVRSQDGNGARQRWPCHHECASRLFFKNV